MATCSHPGCFRHDGSNDAELTLERVDDHVVDTGREQMWVEVCEEHLLEDSTAVHLNETTRQMTAEQLDAVVEEVLDE